MVGKYEITQGDKVVGTMDVSQEGLYYRFRGKCNLKTDCIYRVTIASGEKLGVLIPCNGVFVIDTKRPAKLFADVVPIFRIVTDNENEGNWIPINENTPFPKLTELENGVFQSKDGVPGILFTDPKPSQQGSDPNP